MLQGPSAEHLAGTDGLGRDVLARVLVADEAVARLRAARHGGGCGPRDRRRAVADRARPPRRRGVSGAINTLIAFPGLILALFIAVVFGVGADGAVVALGVAGALPLARADQHAGGLGLGGRLRRRRTRARGVAPPAAAQAHRAEHRRAARAQRHRPRSDRRSSPSRRCRSSASGCNLRSTTGGGCSARAWNGSTSAPPQRSPRLWRSSSPG